MQNENIHQTAECRHAPAGRNTPLIVRFRYWFIFKDHSTESFSYTAKCSKCGERISVPDLYYSFLYDFMYMICCAILVWFGTKLLIACDLHNEILLFLCIVVLLLLTYFLVDCALWFMTMRICKWRAVVLNQEEYEIFIQNERKRFTDDRKIKQIMWFLGIGLGGRLIGPLPKWYIFYLSGVAIGLIILISMRIIKKYRMSN